MSDEMYNGILSSIEQCLGPLNDTSYENKQNIMDDSLKNYITQFNGDIEMSLGQVSSPSVVSQVVEIINDSTLTTINQQELNPITFATSQQDYSNIIIEELESNPSNNDQFIVTESVPTNKRRRSTKASKIKKYEMSPCEDEAEEKKRKNALTAKKHRDNQKNQLILSREQIRKLTEENNELREKIKQKDLENESLHRELQCHEKMRNSIFELVKPNEPKREVFGLKLDNPNF